MSEPEPIKTGETRWRWRITSPDQPTRYDHNCPRRLGASETLWRARAGRWWPQPQTQPTATEYADTF